MSKQKVAGPYSIGSTVWPGLSKLTEEAGELLQVLGKIMGCGGEIDTDVHYDGKALRPRLLDEIADLEAALKYFKTANRLPETELRRKDKLKKFWRWHKEAVEEVLSCRGGDSS